MVVKKTTFMESNLKTYIDSGKMFVPGNLSHYQGGGFLEGLCPLCAPDQETHVSGQYRETFANGVCLPICEDCRYDIDVCDSYSEFEERFNHDSEMAYKALIDYKNTGILPDWIPENPELFSPDCTFCRDAIDWHMPYHKIRVPVSHHSMGNELNVCDTCAGVLKWQEGNHAYEDSCSVCEETYPISDSEHSIRQKNDTLGEYLCHDCYNTQFSDRSPRFLNIICNTCDEQYTLDKAREFDHFSSDGKAHMYTCLDCRTKQDNKIRYSFIIDEDKNYHCDIIKTEGSHMFYFIIYEPIGNSRNRFIMHSRRSFPDSSEATYKAIRYWRVRDEYDKRRRKKEE